MTKPMRISTANISRHINRFERAVRAHEMRGAQMPEDHPAIDREYELAKANLRRFMTESIV